MKKKEKKWTRKCPKCGKILYHTTKSYRDRAEKKGRVCWSCNNKGKNNPHDGKSNYDIWKEKYGEEVANELLTHKNIIISDTRINLGLSKGKNNPMYNKYFFDMWKEKYGEEIANEMFKVTRQKMRNSNLGENNGMFGKKHTHKVKLDGRLRRIKEIEEKHGQIMPNYNPKAIPIILQKAKELEITDLQHAENGGEFQVCGYFVDGYSKEKNIVIEYYEPFHKKQKERDERRKQEIINELNCMFIEIKEN